MVIEKTCPLCNGTGKEQHQFTRDDGETVTESILCELCNGIGHIFSKEQDSLSSPFNNECLVHNEYSPLEKSETSCDISDFC